MKNAYLFNLILISSTLVSMESSNSLTLAMYLQFIALVDKPQKQKTEEPKEYSHQPQQQFKVKKTHQPNVASKHLFSQYYK